MEPIEGDVQLIEHFRTMERRRHQGGWDQPCTYFVVRRRQSGGYYRDELQMSPEDIWTYATVLLPMHAGRLVPKPGIVAIGIIAEATTSFKADATTGETLAPKTRDLRIVSAIDLSRRRYMLIRHEGDERAALDVVSEHEHVKAKKQFDVTFRMDDALNTIIEILG